MRQPANVKLTAAEIGTLWFQYMSDSMSSSSEQVKSRICPS